MKYNYVLSKGALISVMGIMTMIGFALLVTGISLITFKAININNPGIMGGIIFIFSLLLNPLRIKISALIDGLFFHTERAYQEKLQGINHTLSASLDLASVLNTTRQSIVHIFSPQIIHLYLYDTLSDQYITYPDEDKQPTSDIRFSLNSQFVNYLSLQNKPISIDVPDQFPPALKLERNQIALLNAIQIFPLNGRQQLLGWIALGKKGSEEKYSAKDISFLAALSEQSALAIERVQIVSSMENRVKEMNALTRIAQGVNITLSFDDILELVYAQTSLIIPTRDLRLTLFNSKTNQFYHAFFLKDDERLRDHENKPIEQLQELELDCILSRRAILTQDYERECQKRGIVKTDPGFHAWMSVPLNSADETIGALSMGSQDLSISYTMDQLSLFQAIADQTAGAIVKSRLLQESDRRARQLATINDVMRQLTSTLDLEPLLKNILQSAADILDCEAGSLLLVDEQTDELVFKVTVGPVAEGLIDKRLPPGSGMVGKSVRMKTPIIVNDVHENNNWFSKTDQQTGFLTHALLVTPLQVKDNVIGAIEVINKKDRSSFSQDDQDLLQAFADQAAVAINNARLYTQTDKALEARVEELSAMQRIDRELNTSLDIELAMRITLEWAMQQSNATAGFIGIVEPDGLKLMASQGYTSELVPYQDAFMPTRLMNMQSVISNGQLVKVSPVKTDPTAALLPETRHQVFIPIRRESIVIGLIVLESLLNEIPSDEKIGFLSRLSDHAAIAIANAQLYAAVQSANLAKSEFVSFVSHELKNPMTSIKGYTELIAAGAVGPINDAQMNFLNTIRSNVERMSTLVSDLADVSRIEAGRLRLDFKEINLEEIIEEVTRSTRRQIEEKQQKLSVDLADNLPMLWSDRTRLSQIVTNLISNANKYTQTGGEIQVHAETSDNLWNSTGSPKVIHIWVSDNGIGITPDDQKKIFTKFFRSEDPKTREAPGTGLGLNITKSLVEMQGGNIWFESEYRTGTTFHFTVPIAG